MTSQQSDVSSLCIKNSEIDKFDDFSSDISLIINQCESSRPAQASEALLFIYKYTHINRVLIVRIYVSVTN